jgi:SAM-dependent methyltransferase
MITDFKAYEKALGTHFLIPLLEAQGITLAGKSTLDVGCGYGGVLARLHERFGLADSLGIDVDAQMIRLGQETLPPGIRLEAKDFFTQVDGLYDFILMRDVLEHIVKVEEALAKACNLLKPGGFIYLSFAPFYSPFGGHQHNGSGWKSNIPWLQVLPESWFRRLLTIKGNSYKSAVGLMSDMDTVLKTRLTMRQFRSILPQVQLKCKYQAQYLIRPDYKIKFGFPALRFPAFPILEEIFCTGFEAILIRAQPGAGTAFGR